MGGFGQSLGQLGQQSSGSLGSSLGLSNSGLPISSPSQSVYQASYGLNSLGKSVSITYCLINDNPLLILVISNKKLGLDFNLLISHICLHQSTD